MKVGVIGYGNVGMAVFRELQNMEGISELSLIGRSKERMAAEIEDNLDGAVLRETHTPRLTYGGYEKAAGADILIYTVGVPVKSGEKAPGRLSITQANADVACEVFRELNKSMTNPIIIVVSNPVDIITAVIQKETGLPRERVIGSGTLLDTARFVCRIASILEISPRSVDAMVLGEHGNSSVAIISAIRILGMTLDEYYQSELGFDMSFNREQIHKAVTWAGCRIFQGKGFTSYGIASSVAKIVSCVLHDTREILPVSVLLNGEYGLRDVALSVPCAVGSNGIVSIKQIRMAEDEAAAFAKSAEILQDAYDSIK